MTTSEQPRAPRWLVYTQYYPPELGAPQIRLHAMAKELQRHGVEVSVLTGMPNYPTGRIAARYKGKWRLREDIEGVPVQRAWIFAGAGRSTLRRIANYASFSVTGFVSALFGPKPDVIFVEAQPLSLGIGAMLLKWIRNVPYIYNVPDLQVEVAQQLGFIRSKAILRAASAVERLVAKQSWKVSTVTERFVEHFVREGVPRQQVTFLPNGADTDFLRPQAPSQALLNRWQLHGKTIYLYVGTHAYYHGLEIIVDAAALLQQRKDIVILMIGQGPERAALMQRAADLGLTNVVFADSSYRERCQLYSIAHASLVTLRDIEVASQMRPAKIFPSLSCGVPVMCAARGEAADLVTTHGCGVVVAPADSVGLAKAMKDLADDPLARQSMGSAGRALVEREYSWSTIVSRWLGELGVQTGDLAAAPALNPLIRKETV
jgi:glycosyltransferase involved in cell wall biosynthesis